MSEQSRPPESFDPIPVPIQEVPADLQPQLDDPIDAAANAEHERLLLQLTPEELSEQERLLVREKFQSLVGNIARWARESGVSVHEVRRLGGGFKNPVVSVTTDDGQSVVAKAFVEDEAHDKTIAAQGLLSTICKEDEQLLPKSQMFDRVLFSEKAKGESLRVLLEGSNDSPESMERSTAAFFAVGKTLGTIHERSERAIDVDTDQDIIEAAKTDTEKEIRHIESLQLARLLGLDEEQSEKLEQAIQSLTAPEYVSLVHADAHVDQFFFAEGQDLVQIVDYDDIRLGDPMADVSRIISSLREWSLTTGIGDDTEIALTRAIASGYESVRHQSSDGPRELDTMRVVAYELRLHLVKLKGFEELRQKVLPLVETQLHMSESMFFDDSFDDSLKVLSEQLTTTEQARLKELKSLKTQMQRITTYLIPPDTLAKAA